MNWLDWTIAGLLALAAFRGFTKGLVIELVSLLALLLGAWAGVRFGPRVMVALGLEADSALLAFIVTFVLVLVAAHLLARLLTGVIDLAMLSTPNKLAGALFAALRSAFAISIMLNLLNGYTAGDKPSVEAREGSVLYPPVRAFAPLVFGPLGGTKWLEDVAERVRQEADGLLDEGSGR